MIKHKNLAMLYDFAQLEDGSYYMVWEFIDGTNIQKWIAETGCAAPAADGGDRDPGAARPRPPALDGPHPSRHLAREHHAVAGHHGKLLVKVIDFGIAKQLAEGEGGQGLTQTGMFLGKLKYASPEQAGFLKEGEHLDPRSDLYSFGIVLYEMLAGRAPFQATNPHGYILKHVTEKPAPIAELAPNVKVPPQLESVIMRSLEKNRDARFATAADFAAALENLRASIPPDQKFGLGEKMITLSGAQTLADLPKFTGTTPSPTLSGAQQTQQTMGGLSGGTFAGGTMPGTGTRSQADEATVMERNLTMPGGAKTGPTGTRVGSDEATVMERLGSPAGAAPTALEKKWGAGGGAGQAEATVLERQYQPGAAAPKKKNMAVIGAIAAVVVIAIAVAGFMATRKKDAVPVATETVAPSTTAITATAPNTAPIPAGQGVLLLSASPYADLEKIVNKGDQKEIALLEDHRSTPTESSWRRAITSVTLTGPKGRETIDVNIKPGASTRRIVNMGNVDYDALAKEVNKP